MARLAIFAHYDAQAQVKPYILHHLTKLRGVCDRIRFVSTSELNAAELAKLAPLCEDVLLRENVGMDFCMWRDALARLDPMPDDVDSLVLANSSVFGPLSPLETAFATMAERGLDAWGMTDNVDGDWHLQSYFLVFEARVFRSEAFRAFWCGVLPYRSKLQLIRCYELGLSIFLREQGFRLGALAPMAALSSPGVLSRLRGRHPDKNPACSSPVELLDMGVPYVKVEILRDNPERISLPYVRRAMQERGYDMSLVQFDR